MTKEPFGPDSPNPYSSGLLAGPYAFVSGQIARDSATGEIVGGTVTEQTELVIDNLEGVLASAGLGLADVVKTTVFLTDMSTFDEMNAVYRRRFADPRPTRSTIGVNGLANSALTVEIEAVALIPREP